VDEGVCLNPNDIPPNALDDVILGGMIKKKALNLNSFEELLGH
jgi:hypothetical protein